MLPNKCTNCEKPTKYEYCYQCYPNRCIVCDSPIFTNNDDYSHCYLCYMEEKARKLQQDLSALKTKIKNEKKLKLSYKNEKPKQFNIKLRKTIPKILKNQVWDTNIGKFNGVGQCYCCGTGIDSKNFEAGHIISVANGGENNLNNLKPICGCCNKSMGTENMEAFKSKYMKHQNYPKSIYG